MVRVAQTEELREPIWHAAKRVNPAVAADGDRVDVCREADLVVEEDGTVVLVHGRLQHVRDQVHVLEPLGLALVGRRLAGEPLTVRVEKRAAGQIVDYAALDSKAEICMARITAKVGVRACTRAEHGGARHGRRTPWGAHACSACTVGCSGFRMWRGRRHGG